MRLCLSHFKASFWIMVNAWYLRALALKSRAKMHCMWKFRKFPIGVAPYRGGCKGPKEALWILFFLDPPIIFIISFRGIERAWIRFWKGCIEQDISTEPLIFPSHSRNFWNLWFFGRNWCNSPTFLKSVKNRQNLWVMTHDIRISLAKIISFPLRFRWLSWFWTQIQNISGNQPFFELIGAFWPLFGLFGLIQNLSGNEIILR